MILVVNQFSYIEGAVYKTGSQCVVRSYQGNTSV